MYTWPQVLWAFSVKSQENSIPNIDTSLCLRYIRWFGQIGRKNYEENSTVASSTSVFKSLRTEVICLDDVTSCVIPYSCALIATYFLNPSCTLLQAILDQTSCQGFVLIYIGNNSPRRKISCNCPFVGITSHILCISLRAKGTYISKCDNYISDLKWQHSYKFTT